MDRTFLKSYEKRFLMCSRVQPADDSAGQNSTLLLQRFISTMAFLFLMILDSEIAMS